MERQHEQLLVAALGQRGFRLVDRSDTRSWNYVLGDDSGHEVDFHVNQRRRDGNWDYGPEGGPPQDVIPGHALNGNGVIGGRSVLCLTPAEQARYHTGYAVDEKDWADVRALCDRYGIPIPEDYEEFRGEQ